MFPSVFETKSYKMARPRRFERPTSTSGGWRSIQLIQLFMIHPTTQQ